MHPAVECGICVLLLLLIFAALVRPAFNSDFFMAGYFLGELDIY